MHGMHAVALPDPLIPAELHTLGRLECMPTSLDNCTTNTAELCLRGRLHGRGEMRLPTHLSCLLTRTARTPATTATWLLPRMISQPYRELRTGQTGRNLATHFDAMWTCPQGRAAARNVSISSVCLPCGPGRTRAKHGHQRAMDTLAADVAHCSHK